MDEHHRHESGWTPDYLRTTLSPELFDKNLDSLHRFSQELSVVSRLKLLSNENKQVLSKLLPARYKLYIIGHDSAGKDLLAADKNMEQGMITAKELISAYLHPRPPQFPSLIIVTSGALMHRRVRFDFYHK